MLAKNPQMARLFLYLTLLITTTVSAGDGYSLYLENAMEVSVVSLDLKIVDKYLDLYDPDDFSLDHAIFIFEASAFVEFYLINSDYFSLSFDRYSIRAPPALLG